MFSVGFDVTAAVATRRWRWPHSAWVNTIDQDGERPDGAQIAEVHDLDLSGWPAGTRAIARREWPHPAPPELHRRRRVARDLLHH